MRPRPDQSLRSYRDDLQFQNLREALEKTLTRFNDSGASPEPLHFGSRTVARTVYVEALKSLLVALQDDPSGATFLTELDRRFVTYEVFGEKAWGDVLVTGYFVPQLRGSTVRTEAFSEPLYEPPADLVPVRLMDFEKAYGPYRATGSDQRPYEGVLRARLVQATPIVLEPYWTRAEINKNQSKIKSQVLAWVDPIDAFFLHTQGSGRVQFVNGPRAGQEIRVGYANQNGFPYVSIGKNLFDKIPREQMSKQRIESYLRSLPKEQAAALMEQNPSYIFFQKLKGDALTSFGTEVTAGRTIATDGKYFPKGALAFLQFEKPQFANDGSVQFQTATRFVLDQDTGGAIKGPGRVDLFMGLGTMADQASGVMRHRGHLYYLVPRD
jgi:membrane-bound lytic murein transglycosylase A